MGEYVFIRIKTDDGSVRITDENNVPLQGSVVDFTYVPGSGYIPSQGQVSIPTINLIGYDMAFWQRGSGNQTTWVWHNGRLVCG
jgi:hypothetical protein